ncbi:MAG: ATP synthase F1 subunit epsilon [Parcubacteria group bacterium]|nr:ATP synthase F1 subunit epsilon [Parcubacteria group bacterium]
MKKLFFELITPERVLHREEIDKAIVPTKSGQITVLPDHIPLSSLLAAGELVIYKGDQMFPTAISGGFLVVTGKKVAVLADTAERVEEIIIERAEEAKRRAEKMIAEKKSDREAFSSLTAKIEKELVRIRVAKKYQKKWRS